MLRDVISGNEPAHNFRIFGPDETLSNRLDAVFEATSRQWIADTQPDDQWLAPEGRVLEVLSEHQCQGWLEGYLLTGRPPDANCLLSVMDHCLRSRHYVNIVVAGKHPAPQWLAIDAAAQHCAAGSGIWEWASKTKAPSRIW